VPEEHDLVLVVLDFIGRLHVGLLDQLEKGPLRVTTSIGDLHAHQPGAPWLTAGSRT
jgi:hypothetical protein